MSWVIVLSAIIDASVSAVITGRVPVVHCCWQILPLQGDELQAHMIAVGNRVLLRRCRHPFLSYGELCSFIASSFECSVGAFTSAHRPHDHFLLSFPFLLDGIHKFFSRPFRKDVALGDLSAKVKVKRLQRLAYHIC